MGSMDIPSDADDSRPVIDDMAAYNRVFKPKRAIDRSPSRPTSIGSGGSTELARAPPKVPPPQKLFPSASSEGEDEENAPVCPPLSTTRRFTSPFSLNELFASCCSFKYCPQL